MVFYENPFSYSNGAYEKIFNEHKVGVYKLYVNKAINVYRQDGVIKLADKVIKKLFR